MAAVYQNTILKLLGWKVETACDLPAKCVVPVVPHTSAWDFPLGLLTRNALKEDIKFVGKKSLFKGIMGRIFRALGGYPVDRSKHSNFVDATAAIFDELDEFKLSIAPEGTRKKVNKLKTGYYYIAKKANVPIVPCQFDFKNKTVRFGDAFMPTDNVEADLKFFEEYFSGTQGKVPRYSFSLNH